MVRVLNRIHLHFAGTGTGPAMGAFALVYPVLEHGDGIEHRVNGPQGADVFAEGAVYDDG